MAKIFATIDDELAHWIAQQKLFFVATAPLGDEGLINCSPKGGDTFRVLGGTAVAYQDFTGSGVETIAHLRENGRIVMHDSAEAMKKNPDIQEFYLGGEQGRDFRDIKHYRRRKRWLS